MAPAWKSRCWGMMDGRTGLEEPVLGKGNLLHPIGVYKVRTRYR